MEALFVYGTLMPGESHFQLLEPFAADHQPATVRGWLFVLPDGYPALVLPDEDGAWPGPGEPPAKEGPVQGVLCRLRSNRRDTWERLDDYEDCNPDDPNCLFLRTRSFVGVREGKADTYPFRCWVYVWNPARIPELIDRASYQSNGCFVSEPAG